MLVSTVIPTYNRSADVVVAVESALAQRYPADRQEILVIDDGSTDDTAAAVARFGERVRYLPKANGGVSAARNHGIAHARGDAIAFLDSDDTWDPDKLAAQVEVLAARPAVALVLTSMLIVDAQRRPIGEFSRRSTLPVDGLILSYVLQNPAMTPSSAMVRTRVARDIGGFDTNLRTAEDLDFHLRVALHHEIAVVDRPLLHYTRAEGTLGADLRTYRDYMTVLNRFLAQHSDEIDPRERSAALFSGYVKNARGLAYCGAVAEAIGFGLRGVRHASSTEDAATLAGLAAQIGRSAAIRVVKGLRGARSSTLAARA
jgi:glycosyltransferase involved in cell wall biosynthesis